MSPDDLAPSGWLVTHFTSASTPTPTGIYLLKLQLAICLLDAGGRPRNVELRRSSRYAARRPTATLLEFRQGI